MRIPILALVGVLLAGCSERTPDVPYVPTPDLVVDAMLEMAAIEDDDILYDLGSGDGRIPIRAAQVYGIRAVGIDIDPRRVAEARRNAQAAGVDHLVTFRQGDIFESEISEATIVAIYLLGTLNLRLRPKLTSELAAGSRVVSHRFGMSDWKPDKENTVDGRTIYLWTIPKDFFPGVG